VNLKLDGSLLYRYFLSHFLLIGKSKIEHFCLASYLCLIGKEKKIIELMDKLNDEIMDYSDKFYQ
jgi:hypothetical protein